MNTAQFQDSTNASVDWTRHDVLCLNIELPSKYSNGNQLQEVEVDSCFVKGHVCVVL